MIFLVGVVQIFLFLRRTMQSQSPSRRMIVFFFRRREGEGGGSCSAMMREMRRSQPSAPSVRIDRTSNTDTLPPRPTNVAVSRRNELSNHDEIFGRFELITRGNIRARSGARRRNGYGAKPQKYRARTQSQDTRTACLPDSHRRTAYRRTRLGQGFPC